MVSAAHHLVALQLVLSMNGVKPGGSSCSSMNASGRARIADRAGVGVAVGVHGFCG